MSIRKSSSRFRAGTLLVLLTLVTFPVRAESSPGPAELDPAYDNLDGLALIRALVRDQKLTAAERLLEGLSADERVRSRAEIAHLKGLIALQRRDHSAAQTSLLAAARGGSPAWSDLARSYFLAGDPHSCAEAFSRGEQRDLDSALLRSECERESGAGARAWGTIHQAEKSFGATFAVVREKTLVLLKLGLREEARTQALGWLNRERSVQPFLGLAEIFSEQKLEDVAAEMVELARLRAPVDPEPHLAAVPHYYRQGWNRSMAEAFERASLRLPEYAYHVAELRRQTGETHGAYWWNLRTQAGPQRLRQKLALAVEEGRWDLVASMASSVLREKLSDDDEVNYALGFSLTRLDDGPSAERFLNRIRGAALLGKAAALRQKGQAGP